MIEIMTPMFVRPSGDAEPGRAHREHGQAAGVGLAAVGEGGDDIAAQGQADSPRQLRPQRGGRDHRRGGKEGLGSELPQDLSELESRASII